jgi:hypothetical protein
MSPNVPHEEYQKYPDRVEAEPTSVRGGSGPDGQHKEEHADTNQDSVHRIGGCTQDLTEVNWKECAYQLERRVSE